MGNYVPWEYASKNYINRFSLAEAQRGEPIRKQEAHFLISQGLWNDMVGWIPVFPTSPGSLSVLMGRVQPKGSFFFTIATVPQDDLGLLIPVTCQGQLSFLVKLYSIESPLMSL